MLLWIELQRQKPSVCISQDRAELSAAYCPVHELMGKSWHHILHQYVQHEFKAMLLALLLALTAKACRKKATSEQYLVIEGQRNLASLVKNICLATRQQSAHQPRC